jgi:type IV secretory pathway VirD2 relaxase
MLVSLLSNREEREREKKQRRHDVNKSCGGEKGQERKQRQNVNKSLGEQKKEEVDTTITYICIQVYVYKQLSS